VKKVEATIVVGKPVSKEEKLVPLHFFFDDDYNIAGHSLTQKEMYGLPKKVLAGEKITVKLSEAHSGVIVFNQTDKDAFINEFYACIFEKDGKSVVIKDTAEGFEAGERWRDLQYIDHTLYIQTEKGWYAAVVGDEEPSPRLTLVEFKTVQLNSLLRYVFGQNTVSALSSSSERVRRYNKSTREEARREEKKNSRLERALDRSEKENKHLHDNIKKTKLIFAQIKGRKLLFRRLPPEMKRHILETLDIIPEGSLVESCEAEAVRHKSRDWHQAKELLKAIVGFLSGLRKGKDSESPKEQK